MNQVKSLQIGHSNIKEMDFKIECKVMNDNHVEVPFSHRHLFYAVYWIHKGNGTHMIDFKEYEIKPDRLFFIYPEQVHFLNKVANLRYSALQFTEDFIMPLSSMRQRCIDVFKDMNKDEKKRIGLIFKQLYIEHQSGLPNTTAIIQSEVNTLLLELERIGHTDKVFPIVPELLQKYEKLIDNNFTKERQVQSYAMQLGISPNYLNVLCKKHFGKSALEMINDRLVLEVKRLLLRTDYDISEIAYFLGFNELSYFSRFFKRNTGMTPNEFRLSMNEMYQR